MREWLKLLKWKGGLGVFMFLAVVISTGVLLWLPSRRASSPDELRSLFQKGSHTSLQTAIRLVEAGNGLVASDDNCPQATLSLLYSQQLLEFAIPLPPSFAFAEASTNPNCLDAVVAHAMLAFANSDIETAQRYLDEIASKDNFSQSHSIAPEHHVWLTGMLALINGDAQTLETAIQNLSQLSEEQPQAIAYRRLLNYLWMKKTASAQALQGVEAARQINPYHIGLACDEAFLNAYLRQNLSEVADLADQLLRGKQISPMDRGRTLLSRAAVHIRKGEKEAGLRNIELAWPQLAWWDQMARSLALELSLEAGQSQRTLQWLAQLSEHQLPTHMNEVYQAWSLLVDGDTMASLRQLATLPQEHPYVAYLQGLALVEQKRMEEAKPWLERSSKLLPGRIEIEVAKARVETHIGQPTAALRILQGIANHEPFAPRVWTGLGEAYLAQDKSPENLLHAHETLLRATKQEPIAAEAMLHLAHLWQRQRLLDPQAESKALEWFEKSAAANPYEPRYRQELALFLADLGEDAKAIQLLEELARNPGIQPHALLRLAKLVGKQAVENDKSPDLEVWIARAEGLGATEYEILHTRAYLALIQEDRAGIHRLSHAMLKHLEANPADVTTRQLYARMLLRLGDFEQTKKTILIGLRHGEESSHGLLYLVWAMLESRQGEGVRGAMHAQIAWNRMRDLQMPTCDLLEAAELAVHLYMRTDKHSHALWLTRELSKKLPHHGEAWRLRAQVELASDEAKDARQSIAKALQVAPHHAAVHALDARIHLRYGAKEKAISAYTKAIELASTASERAQYQKARGLISL